MSSVERHPTKQEVARRFADLREAAGIDLDTFIARCRLDPEIVRELDAGTRSWTLDDLRAYADVLGVRLSVIFAEWDEPPRGR